MFFSIIIPMYNSQQYITQCLDSLLCQSMSDFEVVVVNDGSNDKSGDIVSSYVANDSRIRLITQANSGQSKARNRGLRESRGQYVIYLDSDDFVVKQDFLEKVKGMIDDTNAEVVMYKYVKYYDGENSRFDKCHYSFSGTEGITSPEKLMPLLAQADAYYASAWSKSVKRDLLINNNIFFDENLSCEDIDWGYRIIENVSVISCLNEEYIAYRQRQGSVTKSGSWKNFYDFLITVEKYKERYESENVSINPELRLGMLGTLAKYYANLLMTYVRVNDAKKKQMKPRLKKLASVLKYGKSKRPIVIRSIYKVFGLSVTLAVLELLNKIKEGK